ncbi:MAG: glycosyltransferase family 2 protein, partial [Thermoanaerobaculia bacterium]|nr:glycosyltransferase family 2 protein [Thermoanaerobaculia bacterium]
MLPVYNEAETLASVLDEWIAELTRLGIAFEIRAYDDGSTDGTAAILAEMAGSEPRLRVDRHENRGHGPTVLRGYREATAEWILQIDSDG